MTAPTWDDVHELMGRRRAGVGRGRVRNGEPARS